MNEAIENIELAEKDLVEFTDEEGYGRFLDVHTIYDKYINIKGAKVCHFQLLMRRYHNLVSYYLQFKV